MGVIVIRVNYSNVVYQVKSTISVCRETTCGKPWDSGQQTRTGVHRGIMYYGYIRISQQPFAYHLVSYLGNKEMYICGIRVKQSCSPYRIN